jgi:hypothetical protein
MVSGKITASPDIAGRSTHLIAGARDANSTLVAGRSDQSHHSHDDSVTDRKSFARLNAGWVNDLHYKINGGCHGLWQRRAFVVTWSSATDYYFARLVHAPLDRNGAADSSA